MASPLVCPRPKYRARTSLPPRNTAVSSVNVTRAAAMPGGALDCVRLTILVRALAVEMISAVGRNLALPPLWSASAAEVPGAHFLAAQEHCCLLGKRDPRRRHAGRGVGLRAIDDIGAGVGRRNDFGGQRPHQY